MYEREWYSIEMDNGEKVIHYHGFACPYHMDNLWSFIDLTWCFVPLAEVIAEEGGERYTLLDDAAVCVQQYQGEYPENEAKAMLDNYYGSVTFSLGQTESSPGTHLKLEDLTMDTPLGHYWF